MNRRPFVSFARRVYRAVPFLPVRQLMYNAFARLVRNRRTMATVDGLVFDLDLGELIDLSLFLQQYEPDVTAAIRRHTRAGMTIVDIGANIGAHTLLFAKLTGSGGRVIAFEPTDFAFSKLKRNLSLNDAAHVEAVKLALSDSDLPPREVNFRSSWRTDGSRRDGVSTVAFQRLDAWSEQTKLGKIDLVKIDVDGNEFPLIVGGRETIARNRPLILMEAVGPHFDDAMRNPFAVLRELGYRFWDLKSGEEQTVEQMAARLPRNDPGMTKSFNVVAATAPPGT
jgi:FkbM family methyltransferase